MKNTLRISVKLSRAKIIFTIFMHICSPRAKAVNNIHFHFSSIEDSKSDLGGNLIPLRYSMGET